ncbi:MAG: hypothetical protein AABZ09_00820, partial [Candidatus Binatota bacterium]
MKIKKPTVRPSVVLALAALLTHLLFLPTSVSSQTPFYQGKTITIIQGRDPGGTGDLRVKAVLSI